MYIKRDFDYNNRTYEYSIQSYVTYSIIVSKLKILCNEEEIKLHMDTKLTGYAKNNNTLYVFFSSKEENENTVVEINYNDTVVVSTLILKPYGSINWPLIQFEKVNDIYYFIVCGAHIIINDGSKDYTLISYKINPNKLMLPTILEKFKVSREGNEPSINQIKGRLLIERVKHALTKITDALLPIKQN